MAYQRLPPQVPLTPEQAKQTQSTARRGAIGCGIAWLVLVSLIILPMVFHGSVFTFLFYIPFAAVGIGMIGWGFIPQLRAVKVEEPTIDFSASTLRLGDRCDVSYRQRFKAPLTVDFAKMTLVLRETAIYRRGTDTYTDKHEIVADDFNVPGRPYQSGEILEFAHPFVIPANGMHTFTAPHNRIEWIVKIHVSVAQWPDFKEEYPIAVTGQQVGPMRMEDR